MKTLTLRSLTHQFLKWADQQLRPQTAWYYRHHLTRFLALTKNKQVKSLRPLHLINAQKSWHDWQCVQRLMRWAVQDAELIRRNPFVKVRAPGRKQRKRILSPRDIARFLRASSRTARRFLLALRELAARPQEIRALRWNDLQSDNPAVTVVEALAAGTAVFVLHDYKDRYRRRDSTVPRVLLVTRRLARLLMRLRGQGATAEGPVFLNSRGKPWTKNAVRCLMRRLRRRLGFQPDERGEKIVAYTFRHSMATLAAAHGVLDRTLADWLGHVETRTTQRYQHLCVGHIREALRRMEKPARDISTKKRPRSATRRERN